MCFHASVIVVPALIAFTFVLCLSAFDPLLTLFSHLCTSLLLCLLPKTGLLLDFGFLPVWFACTCVWPFCLQGSFSLISTFADDALWFCLMQNPYAIARDSFFLFCCVTVQQASSLASSPNLSKRHLPYKRAPHVHIMRAFTGLTSPVWCNKSRRVSTTRQSHLVFLAEAALQRWTNSIFFFSRNTLYTCPHLRMSTHTATRE